VQLKKRMVYEQRTQPYPAPQLACLQALHPWVGGGVSRAMRSLLAAGGMIIVSPKIQVTLKRGNLMNRFQLVQSNSNTTKISYGKEVNIMRYYSNIVRIVLVFLFYSFCAYSDHIVQNTSGWQNGSIPISEAVRAAYLWQNGERYTYDSSASAPLCWVLKSSDYYDPSLIRQITPRVIENSDYPENPAGSGLHPCTIWTPNDPAVTSYKNGVFTESRLVSEGRDTASLSDVVDTRSTYGYRSSAKPPRFIPLIDYSSYGEDPLFSFVGQMIPGTNVQYTDPAIPPVWLVDLKDVDGDGILDVIPALTTIDFTIFKSINWPRERYMSAIEKARDGQQDSTLSGAIAEYDKILSGIIKVTGDVLHAQGGGDSVTVQPGSVFVMNAGESDYDIGFATPNKIDLLFFDKLFAEGREQRPIIWTSNATISSGDDWQTIDSGQALRYIFNLNEYNTRCIATNDSINHPLIQTTIFRYGSMDSSTSPHQGLLIGPSNIVLTPQIISNEFHNVGIAIDIRNSTNCNILNNLIYLNYDRGIFTGRLNGINSVNATGNITIKNGNVGIAPEGNSNEYMYFHNNINAFNQIGVWMLYNNDTPNQFSNPRLEQNNVWQNYCKGPPIPNTIVDYLKGDWTVGGPWIVTDQYAPQNFSNNPNFRNISIYDLVHDTDNDGLFSDVESNSGTYTGPTDTGTDPWNPDSDDDGLLDGVETGTGIYNGPNDTGSDPNNWDTDDDGVEDGTEVQLGYNPVDPEDTPVLPEGEVHPGDINLDWRMVMSEAIAYLAGWQQGGNPMAYAIRAAYLWQNGEGYAYDPAELPPLCWVLSTMHKQ